MNKVIKFFGSYLFLFLVWIMFLISPALSLIRFEIINNRILKNFHISGLTTILHYFPIFISGLALIILVLHFRDFISGEIASKKNRNIFLILTIVTFFFLVISGYLINLENSNYPNYIYEHCGITISQLNLMSFICSLEVLGFVSAYIFAVSLKGTRKKDFYNGSMFERWSFFIAAIGLMSLTILSASTFFNWKNLKSDAGLDYVGRVGGDYQYLKSLAAETDKNVKLILPPQGDLWPAIGNQPIARYFLFPRTLVSGALVNNQEFADSLGEVYFTDINSTSNRPPWPVFDLNTKTIIFDTITPIRFKMLQVINLGKNKIYRAIL